MAKAFLKVLEDAGYYAAKPLLPTIKLPANEHYWTWQLKMLTWYAKYSVPTKVKSMFHPDIRL